MTQRPWPPPHQRPVPAQPMPYPPASAQPAPFPPPSGGPPASANNAADDANAAGEPKKQPPAKIKVRRRILPWHSKTRGPMRAAVNLIPDSLIPSGDDPISAIIGLIVFLIALPFAIPALLLSPFFLIESALQLLIAPFVWLLRLIGAVATRVEVRQGGDVLSAEKVRGWGAAKARAKQLRAHQS